MHIKLSFHSSATACNVPLKLKADVPLQLVPKGSQAPDLHSELPHVTPSFRNYMLF